MHRILFILLFCLSPLLRGGAEALSPEVLIAGWEQEGLPAAPLWDRVREGRAKHVSEERILAALHERVRHLREVRVLLETHAFSLRAPVVQELWITAARVREGGMPPHMIEEILENGAGQAAGRWISLLEVGESLLLSGMDEETAGILMADFSQRSLTRSELLRASRSARQLYAEGYRGEELLQRLEGHRPGGRRGPPEGRGGNGMRRRE